MTNDHTRNGDRPAAREERSPPDDVQWGKGGAWIGGVILILVGVVFLARNFGLPLPENWWSLFILVPGLAAFAGAWSLYRNSGERITRGVLAAASGGLIMTTVGGLFLFGLDIGKFWPLILIATGIAALVGGGLPRRG